MDQGYYPCFCSNDGSGFVSAAQSRLLSLTMCFELIYYVMQRNKLAKDAVDSAYSGPQALSLG